MNVLHALSSTPHLFSGVVGVAASSVPVLEELGLEGDGDAEVLSDSGEQVSGNPEHVSDLDADGGTDLVLPLAGHDLAVGAGDLDASVEAGLVVSVHDGSAVAVVGADGAVVGSLGAGEAGAGPSEGLDDELVLGLEEGVLLLDAEPGDVVVACVEDLLGEVSEVGVGGVESGEGLVSPHVGLAEHDDVVALAEGVGVEGHGLHDDLGVVGGGLVAGRTVVVPLGDVLEALDLLGDGLCLGSESDAAAIDPHVLSNGVASLGQVGQVLVESEQLGLVF